MIEFSRDIAMPKSPGLGMWAIPSVKENSFQFSRINLIISRNQGLWQITPCCGGPETEQYAERAPDCADGRTVQKPRLK
jgi:hypothetical protein